MKKVLFFLLLAICNFFVSCEEETCEEVFQPNGVWLCTDSIPNPPRLTVNDTIIEYCENELCVGSGYYIEGQSIVFGAGVFEIESFDCNSVLFNTPNGLLNFEREE